MTGSAWTDQRRVLDAMRSGEWLRTQWIVRVGFDVSPSADYRPFVSRTRRALRALVQHGRVERRTTAERHDGDVAGVPATFRFERAAVSSFFRSSFSHKLSTDPGSRSRTGDAWVRSGMRPSQSLPATCVVVLGGTRSD